MKLKITKSSFVKSIVDIKDRPKPFLPEFAFAGRSNVGKSSLINCLLNRKNFAKVSKQPGKTRTINYFLINEDFYFVDLPGYGFARISGQEQRRWKQMIENYLLNNEYLKQIMVLIDLVVGPQKNDLQLIEWLRYNQIPFQIIGTKSDRISRNIREKQLKLVRQSFDLSEDVPIIPFSSKDRTGRAQVLALIAKLLPA